MFISPVNTVLHGGQVIAHSTSQHSATWWSGHCVFHQSTQCYMVVRSLLAPPVHTVLHEGQIIVHSTSQHSAGWWSGHCAFRQTTQYLIWSGHCVFHQSSQYHMVVRSLCIPPVNTVLHGGQTESSKSLTHGFRTFSHFGPHIWNNLPNDIRYSATPSPFKSKLKTFLFSEYFS